jgi:hypothetical protein
MSASQWERCNPESPLAFQLSIGSEPSNPRQRSALKVGMHTIRVWIVRRGTGTMDSIIYLVGLIVVVMFILSLLGLH